MRLSIPASKRVASTGRRVAAGLVRARLCLDDGLLGTVNVVAVGWDALAEQFGLDEDGGPRALVAVAELLGHSRLETTAIYTRPSAWDLERAVERLSVEGQP